MIRNKNIAFLISNIDNGGGTERVSLLLADYLCEKGYNVTFFSYYGKGETFFRHNPRVRVIGFYQKGLSMRIVRHFYPTNDQLLHFLLKLLRIDVIIDVDMGQAMYSSAAIQGTKCKHITWDHFNYYENAKSESREKGFDCCKKFSNKFVVLTKADKETYIKNEGLDKTFIEQIYNPLTIEEGLSTKKDRRKIVVAAGRLEKQKGFDLLLQAWSKIEHNHPGWNLEIYGQGSEENNLKTLIKDLGIKNVSLCGRTNDIKSKFAESSIFALSSRFEGFGLVIVEAESMGLPIVSFDCPMGPSEIVDDGENGYLVSPNDIDAFAEKLSLLMENEEIRDRFGRESLNVAKRFRKEVIFPKWIELIESI